LIVSAAGAAVVCDAAGAAEDAVLLAAAEAEGDGDGAWLAVVIPALQAVTDRPAAQIVTAMAMRRCVFNGMPFGQFCLLPLPR